MFKKLISFLFEEEEDPEIIAEDILEPVTLKSESEYSAPIEQKQKEREYREAASVQKTSKIRVESANPQTHNAVKAAPQKKVREEVKAEEKQKSFTSIDLQQEEGRRQGTQRANLRNTIKVDTKKEYEFAPVISPIFGSKEETKSDVKRVAKTATAIKPRRPNPLGTVISPMYGATELEAMEDEAKEKIETVKQVESQPVEDEEIINLPLEDMLEEDVKEDSDSENLTQFSLFGEQEVISSEGNEAYVIKEEDLDLVNENE